MAELRVSEIVKQPWRAKIFIAKLLKNDYFELMTGRKVKLEYTENDLNILDKVDRQGLLELRFGDYRISDFKKTAEFGGQDSINTFRVEDRALEILREQLAKVKSDICKATVPIRVNGRVTEVYDAVRIGNDHKADFALTNTLGQPKIFISHKNGYSPTDFQQWAGVSEEPISSNPEVIQFGKDAAEEFANGFPSSMTVGRKIKNEYLKNVAVYGNAYAIMRDADNVNVVLQGDPKLLRHGAGYYKLSANNVWENDQTPSNEFEPILVIRYGNDRRSSFGINNARALIMPLGGRPIHKWL